MMSIDGMNIRNRNIGFNFSYYGIFNFIEPIRSLLCCPDDDTLRYQITDLVIADRIWVQKKKDTVTLSVRVFRVVIGLAMDFSSSPKWAKKVLLALVNIFRM